METTILYHGFIPRAQHYPATFRTTFKPTDNWLHGIHETEKIPLLKMKKSKHNLAGFRFDFWFRMPGFADIWHGVSIGDTCIVRCKKTKRVTL